MSKDILSLISSKMNTFSKGQKLIANYILSSYDKAAFMTASKLGKTVHVSESTVVRFASELKYDGYPAMQKALQEMIRNKLTSIQRIEVTNDIIGNQDVVSTVMQSDMEKIRLTMEEIDRDSFQAAVDAIVNAKKIYILGTRSSGSLAGFMSFYFGLMFDNVVHVGESANQEIFDQIVQVGHGDVTIVFPADGPGHQLCPRAGFQGHRHHRQRLQQHGQGGGLCAAGQERHGLLCGLPGGSPEPD